MLDNFPKGKEKKVSVLTMHKKGVLSHVVQVLGSTISCFFLNFREERSLQLLVDCLRDEKRWLTGCTLIQYIPNLPIMKWKDMMATDIYLQ